jgi:hypothetical protein
MEDSVVVQGIRGGVRLRGRALSVWDDHVEPEREMAREANYGI